MSPALIVAILFLVMLLAIVIAGIVLVVRELSRGTVSTPPPGAPYLVGHHGSLEGKKFTIPTKGLTIGRHRDNMLRLNENLVSRYHAQIVLEKGQYILRDRDSSNGTWVNDRRIRQHVLQPDDVIQIGLSRFIFKSPTPYRPRPKPSTPRVPVYVPPISEPQFGQSFDGYRLESVIGRGGMSVVYRARSQRDGKQVAIKVLEETEPYLIKKFIQWGRTIGPLLQGHPHIASVYHFGESSDGRLYIVEELVEGPSLRMMLRRPFADEGEISTIVGQTCDALRYAHHCGVIHRDIKPENILFSRDGTIKVTDFGIAKLTSAVTITRDKLVGTPEYMSYEQARGDRVKFTSDLYSLGIVLYEMLTGTVPFRRPPGMDDREASLKVIEMHIRSRPPAPSTMNPNVSPTMEKVVLRALEKDWKKRFQTAVEMGSALGYHEYTPIKPPVEYSASARLIVVEGRNRGKVIPLESIGVEGITIRRADIDPEDTLISRSHAIISYQGGQFWLEDISTNGTYRDRQRLYGETPLHSGDVLLMGRTYLRFET